MDNVNRDLILELAAGNLPEAEARAVEASLSPEERAELDAQRAVLAAIAASPVVAMTDIERARLHRSVAAAISETTRELSPVAVAAPPPGAGERRGRSTVWMRWASAAAVAATLVGVVAVGSQLGLGGLGNRDSADTIAEAVAAAETSTTTAAAAAAGSEALRGYGVQPQSAAGDDGVGAAESDTFAATDEAAELLLQAPALTRAPEESNLRDLTDFVIGAIDTRRTPVDGITSLPCYAVAAEEDDLDIVRGFVVPYPGPDGGELSAIAYADAGTDTTDPLIRIYDIATCRRLAANTG